MLSLPPPEFDSSLGSSHPAPGSLTAGQWLQLTLAAPMVSLSSAEAQCQCSMLTTGVRVLYWHISTARILSPYFDQWNNLEEMSLVLWCM